MKKYELGNAITRAGEKFPVYLEKENDIDRVTRIFIEVKGKKFQVQDYDLHTDRVSISRNTEILKLLGLPTDIKNPAIRTDGNLRKLKDEIYGEIVKEIEDIEIEESKSDKFVSSRSTSGIITSTSNAYINSLIKEFSKDSLRKLGDIIEKEAGIKEVDNSYDYSTYYVYNEISSSKFLKIVEKVIKEIEEEKERNATEGTKKRNELIEEAKVTGQKQELNRFQVATEDVDASIEDSTWTTVVRYIDGNGEVSEEYFHNY